jgi:CheY-like chemotaxis protein
VPTELNPLVKSVAEMLRRTSPPQIELELDLDDGLPKILADATQIEQVVMNLCLNAIQASEPPAVVEVRSWAQTLEAKQAGELDLAEDEYVCLRVQDKGCGMDAPTRKRIFEPFFTTKATGRGMGLPATLGIIHSHNGQIRVDSQAGSGTTITVWLPVATEDQAESITAALPTEPFEPPRGTETILVIDDEEAVVRTVEQILSSLGYIVITHTDTDSATAFVRSNSEDIELVLLDLNMPKCDGRGMLNRITEVRADVPVLLASGFDEQEPIRELLDRGAVGFVQKPFSLMVLARHIRQALDAHQASVEGRDA